MPDGSVPLLVAIIVLIILSGFFSATETAYSCASKIKLKNISEKKPRALNVLRLTERYDSLISTVLVGNNIVNITASSLATIFFAKIILANGLKIDSTTLSTIVMTVAVLIFGEITPKFIAKTYPEKVAMAFYPIITFFSWILYPINLIFRGYKFLISKIFKLKSDETITEEEIITIVEEAQEDGTLKEEETNLIRSVIEFDDLEVGDVLVPRVNIIAVDVDAPLSKVKELFDGDGYSRLPVYKETVDNVIGILHEKDFFSAFLKGKKDISKMLQPVVYTTEHIKISALLKQLQKKKTHMAVVLDEYGGTLGIVTLEDILEELVGEIYDEHDEEVNYFRKINGVATVVDCKAPLCDFFENFELLSDYDVFEANTVSGWIIEQLGEIPKSGTNFEYEHLKIEVTKSTVKRVQEVKVTLLATKDDKKAKADKPAEE